MVVFVFMVVVFVVVFMVVVVVAVMVVGFMFVVVIMLVIMLVFMPMFVVMTMFMVMPVFMVVVFTAAGLALLMLFMLFTAAVLAVFMPFFANLAAEVFMLPAVFFAFAFFAFAFAGAVFFIFFEIFFVIHNQPLSPRTASNTSGAISEAADMRKYRAVSLNCLMDCSTASTVSDGTVSTLFIKITSALSN